MCTGLLPVDAEGSLLFQFWPVRNNLAPLIEELIPSALHKELAGKKIFCLARGGPTAATGKNRYCRMSEGCVIRVMPTALGALLLGGAVGILLVFWDP